MSRRVQITRQILRDLVRRVRATIQELKIEEDKLILLIDWYGQDLEKIIKNGVIIKDGISSRDL